MTVDANTTRRGWYHGWNIVAVCVLAQTAGNGLPVNAFSLFLQDWSKELNAPISTLQLGLAALGVFSAVFSPIVGGMADKYPTRWLMGGGLLAIAVFYLGVSFVTTSGQLLALFAVVLPGAVAFSTTLPANAVISRWFTRRLGMALGISAFGLGAASAILPPIIAVLLPEFGWRMVWRGGGLIILCIVTPLVMWVLRDRPTERDGLHYMTADGMARSHHGHGGGGGGGGGGSSSLSWRDVFARKNFWLLVAVFLPMLALNGGSSNNLAPIAVSRGLTQQTGGVLLSVFGASHIVSTLIMGMLSDRFGNRLPLFGLAMATASGGAIVAFGHSAMSLGVGMMLVGLSGGMWPLLAAAAAREFGASHVGRAFGLLMMFLPIIVLAPFTVAKFHETTGSYVPGLIGLAVLTFMGGVACLMMRERGGGRAADTKHCGAAEQVITSTT